MLLSVRNVRFIKLPKVRTLGTMGLDTYAQEVLIYLRGCLHANSSRDEIIPVFGEMSLAVYKFLPR